MEEIENLLSRLDEDNEKLLQESIWCRRHKFEIQADVLSQKYQYGYDIIKKIKWKLNKNSQTNDNTRTL